MPKFSATFSAPSLDALLKDLRAYQKKVEDAPAKICDALLDTGKQTIEQVVDGIRDPIGNAPGIITSDRHYSSGKAAAELYYSGSQVSFVEYGVGVRGAQSPHPAAGDINWDYESGSKINRKTGYWRYYDKLRGKWRTTNGLPAQKPMLESSIAMRFRVAPAAKEALK